MKGEVNMNNLMKFESQEVEVFEYNGKILFNPYHVGRCLELSDSSVRKSVRNFNENQRVKLTKSNVTSGNNLDIPTAGRVYLTESGVYKLIFKSRKKEAEKFPDWVTDEVLPAIRQTGKYEVKKTIKPVKIDQFYEVKYYKGKPVMVMRDLVDLFDSYKEELNYLAVTYNLGTVLKGNELSKFKKENPQINMKFISVIRVFTRKDVHKFSTETGFVCDRDIISKYFDISEMDDYERFKLIELAKDIRCVANTRGFNTPYAKMLTLVASKIYVDCGFLDEVTDDLSTHNPVGWNLQQPILDFNSLVRVKLK